MKKCCTSVMGWVLIGFCVACSEITSQVDKFLNISPRESYVRKFFSEEPPFTDWQAAYEQAFQDSLEISLPFTLDGQFHSPNFFAHGYVCTLEEGQQLLIENLVQLKYGKIFVEVFKQDSTLDSEASPILSETLSAITPTSLLINASGRYKVMIQPTMYLDTSFSIRMYASPSFLFPVVGATNRSILSFWGDPRDGGRRIHKGIDIFAPRGTPIVAVADGYIRFTGERGLGGKQVWLRDELYNYSVYYAHLDSISSHSGDRVKRGDTLGFVGNTGNARFTPPHLHFGIYKRRRGATDPLAFVKLTHIPEPYIHLVGPSGIARGTNGKLRTGPGNRYPILENIHRGDTLALLGKSQGWYHIATSDNHRGFLSQRNVKEMPTAIDL